jgi:hypothetical protein
MPDPIRPGEEETEYGLPAWMVRPGPGQTPPNNSARSLLGQLVGPDAQAQAAERDRQRRQRGVETRGRALASLRRGEATTEGLARGMRERGELETVAARATRDQATIPGTGVTYSPGAMASGGADVLTMGHTDELAGAVGALRGQDYTQTRDARRRNAERMREENPGSYALGAAAALPLAAVAMPSVATAGLTRAGAIGARALEGGIAGGLASSGASDLELGEDGRMAEGLRGIATGGVMGGAMESLGQTVTQMARGRQAAQADEMAQAMRGRDRARLREAINEDDPLAAAEIESLESARPVAEDRMRRLRDSRGDALRELLTPPQRAGRAPAPAPAANGSTNAGSPQRFGRAANMPPERAASLRQQMRAPMPGPDERSYGLVDELLPNLDPTNIETATRATPQDPADTGTGGLPAWMLEDDDR